MPKTAALILAAGKGTRMHSDKPKVLQTLLGEPMLACVLEALRPVFGEDVWIVAGHRADLVQAAFPQARFVLQKEQLGTGHALLQALPALTEAGCSQVLVVNGDVPLLSESLVRQFLAEGMGADLAFATIEVDNPGAYGRVVRRDDAVTAIVEAKDYDPALLGPASNEVNAGMYLCDLAAAAQLLPQVGNKNKSGEYYITDLVALAVARKYRVRGVRCGRDAALLGVNAPRELAQMEETLRTRIVEGLLDAGVMLHAPDAVRVGPRALVEPGAELTGVRNLWREPRGPRGQCGFALPNPGLRAGRRGRSAVFFASGRGCGGARRAGGALCPPAARRGAGRSLPCGQLCGAEKNPPGQGGQGQPPHLSG